MVFSTGDERGCGEKPHTWNTLLRRHLPPCSPWSMNAWLSRLRLSPDPPWPLNVELAATPAVDAAAVGGDATRSSATETLPCRPSDVTAFSPHFHAVERPFTLALEPSLSTGLRPASPNHGDGCDGSHGRLPPPAIRNGKVPASLRRRHVVPWPPPGRCLADRPREQPALARRAAVARRVVRQGRRVDQADAGR